MPSEKILLIAAYGVRNVRSDTSSAIITLRERQHYIYNTTTLPKRVM